MRQSDYKQLRDQIRERYAADLAALDRVWEIAQALDGDEGRPGNRGEQTDKRDDSMAEPRATDNPPGRPTSASNGESKWPDLQAQCKPLPPGLGVWLAETRREMGISQRDVAERLGFRQDQISQIERGVKHLSWIDWGRIFDAIGREPDDAALQRS